MEKRKLPYLNRELSWLEFNSRVLEEAMKKTNPLMERLRFLSITGSNLDEFFMVRVAGVKAQVAAGINKSDESGLTPAQLMGMLDAGTHEFMEKQYSCYQRSIMPMLKKADIHFCSADSMTPRQLEYISVYFKKALFPVLTPLAVDGSRPFPQLANKTLNIAVRLREREKGKKSENFYAIVQVPSIISRFLELPAEEGQAGHSYALLEDVIIYNLPELFELHDIRAAAPFRITRNSDLEIDEEAEDFLTEVQNSIKRRKRGRPVRLEINSRTDKSTKKFLLNKLKIRESEIYEFSGPIDLTFLSKFAGIKHFRHLCYSPIAPVPPIDFVNSEDMMATIRSHDCMVHHPYESFDAVTNFIRLAAEDENVLAIKQTLYRVSGNSPIIAALEQAAENGKQVTVLVELKARFDEENNINWAKKLEKAGCHVIYGLHGLKTHCKIALVVRREDESIKRYLHLGTGNYNDSTARIYTDTGIFTCNNEFGVDASSLFNVITGYSRPPLYNHFIVAPQGMRKFFKRMIQAETENAKQGRPNGITIKINSLVDAEIVYLLYEASMAGVKINLVVRGICCLVPGVEGVSENITVTSIVGRFLEHSRIFKFENGGNVKYFMGSADLMPRNLDRRVELIFPIYEERLKQRVDRMLQTTLNDNTNSRIMNSDGSYHPVNRRGKPKLSSQMEFYKEAEEEYRIMSQNEEDLLIPIHEAD